MKQTNSSPPPRLNRDGHGRSAAAENQPLAWKARVYQPTQHVIAAILVGMLGMVVVALATWRSAAPVAIRVVSITEELAAKRVTVEFLRLGDAASFAEEHQYEIRAGGRWQPPLRLPKGEDGYLLARANSQRLVLELPREAEACRFLIGYRVGRNPYCRAYSFLWRYGVSQRFPALSKAILKRVPRQPKLRHFECELETRGAVPDPTTQQGQGGTWSRGDPLGPGMAARRAGVVG